MTAFKRTEIACAQTLGERLRRARKRKRVELRVVEKETKVAFKYLQALENGQYQHLPAPLYVRGFLTRYADFLSLKPEGVLECYEREQAAFETMHQSRRLKQSRVGLLRPRVTDEWLKQANSWQITPGVLWGSVIGALLFGIIGYTWFQVTSFAAAPPLEITTPGEVAVSVELVEITGMTDPTAELTINHQPVAVNEDGQFRQEMKLSDGMNTIEISAKNKAEKETVKTIQLLADIEQADRSD